jgi:hypothetical protein
MSALIAAAPAANPFLAAALSGPSNLVPDVVTFRGLYETELDAAEVRDGIMLANVGTLKEQFSSWSTIEVVSVNVHFTLPANFSATLLVGIVPEFHILEAKHAGNGVFTIPWSSMITYTGFTVIEWRSQVTMPMTTDVPIADASRWPIGLTSRSLTNLLPGFSLPALEVLIRSTSSSKLTGRLGILVEIEAKASGRGYLSLPRQ